jgi:UDP-glucuronate decarboxylase
MRILVTGGAGFLGSHLCDRLIARANDDVICLDNYFTGSRDNIAHLMSCDHFTGIRHDVIHYMDIDCNQIYNLASPASPIHYQRDPIRTLEANVMGVSNALQLALRTGARMLQASTSEVYGDPQVSPQSESYWGHVNPLGPRSCYDEGKRAAETLMMDYRRQHNVDIGIARIFNTYGPRMAMNDGRVVSNFIVQALRGEAITIFGNGQQTRSFCYVSDLLDGLLALMAMPDVEGPVNLGNPDEITILQLAEEIRELTGSKSKLVSRPLPVDDPIRRCPDISRAQQLLNWKPRVSLSEGLGMTIEYFDQLLSQEAGVPSSAGPFTSLAGAGKSSGPDRRELAVSAGQHKH